MAINLEDHELENQLRSELQGVADRVTVPPMPNLGVVPESADDELADADQARRGWWNPTYLAVAAVAALIVGLVATLSVVRGDDGNQRPAPAGPSDPTSAATSAPAKVSDIPTTVPTLPHINGTKLVFEGKTVPGKWYNVKGGPEGWIAQRFDGRWWWGNVDGAQPIANIGSDDVPDISPSGKYVAYISNDQGKGTLTGFATDPAGEGLGGIPIEAGSRELGTKVQVGAVTDDGRIIALGGDVYVLWTPTVVDSKPIDMTDSLKGQSLWGATAEGVIVNTSDSSIVDTQEYYLARITDDGQLEKVRDIPSNDDLSFSSDGDRMVWSQWGTTQGDVLGLDAYQKGTVSDGRTGTVRSPKGWVMSSPYGWEDNEYFIIQLSRGVVEADVENRLGRCSFTLGECAFIKSQE